MYDDIDFLVGKGASFLSYSALKLQYIKILFAYNTNISIKTSDSFTTTLYILTM